MTRIRVSPDGERVPADVPDPGLGVALRDVTVSFPSAHGGAVVALDGLSLELEAGTITAFIGPNGCGKSTTLRVMAGLLHPERGSVSLAGGGGPLPGDGRVGMVFQQPRLVPWLTTLDNVALPLALARVSAGERRDRATTALAQVGMTDAAHLRPRELSGGMAQRAALARALVGEPQLLLLDEPFSALDALSREAFDSELQRLWLERRRTLALVTHSVAEAVRLADRVLVFTSRPGRVAASIEVSLARPRPVVGGPDPRRLLIEEQVRDALSAVRPIELAAWTGRGAA